MTNPEALTAAGTGTTTLNVTAGGDAATVLLDYGQEVAGTPYVGIKSSAITGTNPLRPPDSSPQVGMSSWCYSSLPTRLPTSPHRSPRLEGPFSKTNTPILDTQGVQYRPNALLAHRLQHEPQPSGGGTRAVAIFRPSGTDGKPRALEARA